MRANDGNAYCCFSFINGSTLVHQIQLFITNGLLLRWLFFSLYPSRPHSVSYPSSPSSLIWSGFSSFSSIYTFLLCLLICLFLITTPSSMNTNMRKYGPDYFLVLFQWAGGNSLGETFHVSTQKC